MMKKDLLIPLIIGVAMIAILLMVSSTLVTVLVFIPGVIFTYIFYLFTAYKQTPDPERILPLYLLALGIQFLHFAEEYIAGFAKDVPRLLNQEEYPIDYWLVFNMTAYFLFILGGTILFKKIKELMIIPLFFIVVGVVLNTIGHILISIYVGGYFPGLYTVFLYLLVGPILVKRFLHETKSK